MDYLLIGVICFVAVVLVLNIENIAEWLQRSDQDD
jgi:hypothetical protein